MAAPVQSKQRNGTLMLGGTLQVNAQTKNVKISAKISGAGDSLELLSGDILSGDGETEWTLSGSAIQDWSDPAGLTQFSWDNHDQDVAFTWAPAGANGPTYAGTCHVVALDVGGDVGKRLEHDFEWACSGKPVVNPAAP